MLRRAAGGWEAVVDGAPFHARFVIFANGRGASPGGAVPRSDGRDRLVCRYAYVPDALVAPDLVGFTLVEAVADGWWYHAVVPGGAVIALHTDADLAAARQATDPAGFAALLGETRSFAVAALPAGLVVRRASARGQAAGPVAGRDWCRIGDAAAAFDPLASQGLFHALYTGVTGGEAVAAALAGDAGPLKAYQGRLAAITARYAADLARHYAAEQRFAVQPFWQRRHGEGHGLVNPATLRQGHRNDSRHGC